MEKVIRFVTYEPLYITRAEYLQIKKDVESRFLAGCHELGDQVLAKLLLEHSYRAKEIE